MIIQSTEKEVRAIVEMAKNFEQATKHVVVDVNVSTKNYLNFISTGIGVMFALMDGETVIGGLGALKCPDIHSGQMMAVETFWFVLPEYRGKGIELFRAFESWARAQNCVKAAMIHLEDSFPEVLKKFYTRSGYKLVESHYVKELAQ